MIDAGKVCGTVRDEKVRNLKATRVQVDEIWSLPAKAKKVACAKAAPAIAGDTWTWTAIEADASLSSLGQSAVATANTRWPSWMILRDCLANRVELTRDGHRAYLEAVEGAFGADVHYALTAV